VYQGQIVLLHCSTDAIVPAWAYVLVSVALAPWAIEVFKGSVADFLSSFYAKTLAQLDYEVYRNKPVILKGCSKKPVPDTAYLMAMKSLQLVARSVMYGEACSAVPLYKQSKT